MGYKIRFEPEALVYHYSHCLRVNRKFIPFEYRYTTPVKIIARTTSILRDANASWPDLMKAGLTISSLTENNAAFTTIDDIGNILLNHWDFDVRWRMAQTLGKIKNEKSVFYLIKSLNDPSFYVKDESAWSLAKLGPISAEILINLYKKGNLSKENCLYIALALGMSKFLQAENIAISIFSDLGNDKDISIVRDSFYFFGEMEKIAGTNEVRKNIQVGLSKLTDPKYSQIHNVIVWALGNCLNTLDKDFDISIITGLIESNTDPITKFESIIALGKIGINTNNKEISKYLLDLLDSCEGRLKFGILQIIRTWRWVSPDFFSTGIIDNINFINENDFGVQYEQFLLTNKEGNINEKYPYPS